MCPANRELLTKAEATVQTVQACFSALGLAAGTSFHIGANQKTNTPIPICDWLIPDH